MKEKLVGLRDFISGFHGGAEKRREGKRRKKREIAHLLDLLVS